MRIATPLSLLSCLALLSCSQVPPPITTTATSAPPTQVMANAQARVLAAHNRERAAVGVPALTWDPQLAADAASYGADLAALGRLQHSPRSSRPGQSENLWVGTRGAYTPEQMVGTWAAEKVHFLPGVFPNVSRTGNWIHVGHYTQMIWRSTARLGCAIHQAIAYEYLICRYSPRGNIDGHRVL